MKSKTAKTALFGALFFLFLAFLSCVSKSGGWRTASRASSRLAPLPKDSKEAVVQVYAASLWGLRGKFADHTWIAAKKAGAASYTVYEVIGWRKMAKEHDTVLRIERDIPDRLWFGSRPRLLADFRGGAAGRLIGKIHAAALAYPHKTEYSMVFGPNSNTFTAWIACRVPELRIKLSRRAIGKNYLKGCKSKPSDSGEGKPSDSGGSGRLSE